MGFSLTILALLARLRVLAQQDFRATLQQMLLDVVSVFNLVSSVAQKKRSVKLIQEGLEVFREYYPSNDEIVTLECIWKIDKFVLVERTNKSDFKNHDGNLEPDRDISLGPSMIKYQSIEAWLGEDEVCDKDKGHTSEELDPTDAGPHKTDASPDPNFNSQMQVEDFGKEGVHLANPESPNKNFDLNGAIVASTSQKPEPISPELQSGSSLKVAFVSVRKSAPPPINEVGIVEPTTNVQLPADDNEDPLFSLLGAKVKDSLF
ncbi:uncharacterized protein LOC122084831 isoform X1 [Macadamia integrifolia]|uniref:uncharacterized protein LOC122084831 isoform X1 n=1 Tax=Macadamia integrifolia TaxID=60698 RepID=UPI001C4F0D5A|nr:uncharacterized protein LOC122084831 isoform X1 [Macadamia integrifolia]XP_042509197.1 uncharacterized protein LOC122084831 isoform X1 [Macadamia integrifolia]